MYVLSNNQHQPVRSALAILTRPETLRAIHPLDLIKVFCRKPNIHCLATQHRFYRTDLVGVAYLHKLFIRDFPFPLLGERRHSAHVLFQRGSDGRQRLCLSRATQTTMKTSKLPRIFKIRSHVLAQVNPPPSAASAARCFSTWTCSCCKRNLSKSSSLTVLEPIDGYGETVASPSPQQLPSQDLK